LQRIFVQHALDFFAAHPGGVQLKKILGFFKFVLEIYFYAADTHVLTLAK
jgi:hypothetical protein